MGEYFAHETFTDKPAPLPHAPGQPIFGTVLRFLSGATALLLLVGACADDDRPTEEPPAAASDAGAPPPAEKPPTTTPRDAGPIEVDCPTGSAVEVEDNGSPQRATFLGSALTMCGALTPGDDVDYSSFQTPAGKKLELFQAVVDGAVDFELVVNGKTLKPSDVKSFEPGDYIVKAFSTDGKPARYRYRIQYEL